MKTMKTVAQAVAVGVWETVRQKCRLLHVPLHFIVRWQHDETGRIVELPWYKNPGRRWYRIKPPNAESEALT